MAAPRVSKVYAVEDAKIAVMTADTGASPTYSASIDVPGIKTVEISGTVENKQLRGDNTLLDSNSTLTDISVSVSHAKISLDVLDAIVGGTVTDSGTGTNEVATWDLLGTDSMQYFKLEARTPANGADPTGGDVHFILWKCMIDSLPSLGHAEEDYRIVSFTAKASPAISNSKWITAEIRESSAALT